MEISGRLGLLVGGVLLFLFWQINQTRSAAFNRGVEEIRAVASNPGAVFGVVEGYRWSNPGIAWELEQWAIKEGLWETVAAPRTSLADILREV